MTGAKRPWRQSWSIFDGWTSKAPSQPSDQPTWTLTDRWMKSVSQLAKAEAAALRPLLQPWEAKLKDIGGDPSADRWELFRPLRLSREEDWSDWLGWLLQAEPGAGIARSLFGPPLNGTKLEKLLREVPVAGGARRADLVLLWKHRAASHVEVKLWDTSFGKTAETAKACEAAFRPRRTWRHNALLPDELKEDWQRSAGTNGIYVVTWTDLVVELRRALLMPRQDGQWRAFARAYCGAIERQILGIPPRERLEMRRAQAAVFRFGRILEEASHGAK